MLKIYGAAHSRAFRVIWLANEIGLPYEHIPVTFGVEDAQCKEPWYLELNPNGRVPTIDDGGFVLWESSAINLYLAEKYKSPLFPSTPQGKGNVLQWAFFTANDVEPPVICVLRNRIIFPPHQRDAAIADEAEQTLAIKFGILEKQLGRTPFFGGEAWNLADFMIACVLYIVPVRLRLDMRPWPKLEAWIMASIERPAALAARKLRERPSIDA
jgi:glutathione S-transferase